MLYSSQWLLGCAAFLAIYLAWNLGANDAANSIGTSVGSKVLTLRKALALAAMLEFTGAVLFSRSVITNLTTHIVPLDRFVEIPETLMLGMLATLLTAGGWLQIATFAGMPVSSSHAVIGAISGFTSVALGPSGVNWQSLLTLALVWIVTPVGSGLITVLLYFPVKHGLLGHADAMERWREWSPWLATLVVAIFASIAFPSLAHTHIFRLSPLPTHTMILALGGALTFLLMIRIWQNFAIAISNKNCKSVDIVTAGRTLDERLEGQFKVFQTLSAGFVAFAHGANDVGNAIAPFAVVVYLINTPVIPKTIFPVPDWILLLGATAIVMGLVLQGKRVIATIGEGVTSLKPTSGFCAELGTAATVLLASRFGFPVSTSHALVGAVLTIGLVNDRQGIDVTSLRSIILTWIVTLPMTALLGAVSFIILHRIL